MTPDPPEPSGLAPGHDDSDSTETFRASRDSDGESANLAHPIEPSFRHLAESLPELVWSARPDGTTDYSNGRLLDYLGTTAAEMRGRDWAEVLHPDEVERGRRAWEHARSSGSGFEAEARIRRHDGEYRWHRVRATAMRDDSGRVARWFGTGTDIHEQRAAGSCGPSRTTPRRPSS
jgi:PAS domain S-box-containing protein